MKSGLRWTLGLHENDVGLPTDGGTWFPDNEANRRDLEIIVEAGIEAYGPGTHWLEQRQA